MNEEIRYQARSALLELKEHKMKVILVPAPDPQHSMHMIRSVESRPPAWYMEYYSRRWWFKRRRFYRALRRLAKGETGNHYYQRCAFELSERRAEGDPEAFLIHEEDRRRIWGGGDD